MASDRYLTLLNDRLGHAPAVDHRSRHWNVYNRFRSHLFRVHLELERVAFNEALDALGIPN